LQLESPAAAASVTPTQPGETRKIGTDRFSLLAAHNGIAGELVLADLIGLLIGGIFVWRIMSRITTLVAAPGL
jgi:hypothetical protein